MSSLIVEVCEIKEIKKHLNANSLEICVIKGWESIVPIGKYKVGDAVIYIPVDAILPIELADRLGVRNYLGGKNKDRVRCAKLRKVMSYGLIMDNEKNWEVGTDVAKYYGIIRYNPPIMVQAGDAAPNDPLFHKFTEIENINNFPDIFEKGEVVVITEKLDGSSGRVGWSRSETSIEWKAGSHKVKRKKPDSIEKIRTNTYWFMHLLQPIKDLLDFLIEDISIKDATLFGEIYGKVRGGHKSLHYGKPDSLNYAAFSLMINGIYVSWNKFYSLCEKFDVPVVPVIEVCEFSIEKMKELATGYSLLAKQNGVEHMKEGIVIVSEEEREEFSADRAILKMLNPDYLILKNKSHDKGEVTDFTDE